MPKSTTRRKGKGHDNYNNGALEAFSDDGMINVIIETPKGHRNKFKYDPKLERFMLGSVLPAGASFPYDFGFVAGTKAADGDPLDVLLLMDESAFPGCLVVSRIVGVIEAEQTEDDETIRNDRIIAVPHDAHDYRDVRTPSDLNKHLLKELEHFFVSYNEMRGKKFKLLALRGPKHATTLIKKSVRKPRKG
jgi:inorganic pyrophosphatase